MTLVPSEPWYTNIIAAVDQQQAGIKDHLGRPWAQHFERVALRLIFRKPDATRAHIEAALLHDAMMERGGGREMLEALGVSREACEIIEITTPPPNADYYRRFQDVGPAECAIYLDYVRKLCSSGNRVAIEMKLADITDTIETCRTGQTPLLIDQFVKRYEPSRKLLEQALGTDLG
jgi:hypothetical protein